MAAAIARFSPAPNWFCLSVSGCRIVIYFAGNICSLRSFLWLPVVEAKLCVYPQAKQGSDTRRLSSPAQPRRWTQAARGGIASPEDERGSIFHASSFLGGFAKKRGKKKKKHLQFSVFSPFFKKREHQSYHSCFLTIIPQILMYVSQSFHAKSTRVCVFCSI